MLKVSLLICVISDDNADACNVSEAVTRIGTPGIAAIYSGAPDYADAYDAFYSDIPSYLSYQHLLRKYGFDPVFIPTTLDNYVTVKYK